MKKRISYSIIFLYLVSVMHLTELLKLPVLFHHFNTHKKENNNISFISFLEMHYLHGNVKDADYEDDMKLPFKMMTNLCCSQIIFISQTPVFIFQKIKFFIFQKKHLLVNQFFENSFYNNAIWQPPK